LLNGLACREKMTGLSRAGRRLGAGFTGRVAISIQRAASGVERAE
jgi:hypothetical protein